jgi:ABC-type transporter MlaC component
MAMTYVTESAIPFNEAFLMSERFKILNMASEGIWFVDTQHSKWPEIKKTAIDVAKTFGDAEALLKLTTMTV